MTEHRNVSSLSVHKNVPRTTAHTFTFLLSVYKMASASSLLSEDQFQCSICLDVFTDPVSTPCGHNYCKACITQHWDSNDVCKCPLCNKTFHRRPEVFVNTFISEMADQFRKSLQLRRSVSANREAA